MSGTLGSGGTITSGTIILALNGEPTDDGDGDVNTNRSLDFGVRSTATGGTLAIGSTVWNDVNNNGLLDTGETGIDGVTLQLLNSAGNVVNTTTTAGGGVYAFTGLAAGDYTVRLAATNFNTGGVLAGYTSSTGTNGALTGGFEGSATPDPDTDTDNDDNGQVTGTLGNGGTIGAAPITLAAGQEPGSSDTNNTLDFGLFRKLSLGNVVFNDLDNSGTVNGGETGIAGITVRLLDAAGTTQIATTTTNPSGQYLFTNLDPGRLHRRAGRHQLHRHRSAPRVHQFDRDEQRVRRDQHPRPGHRRHGRRRQRDHDRHPRPGRRRDPVRRGHADRRRRADQRVAEQRPDRHGRELQPDRRLRRPPGPGRPAPSRSATGCSWTRTTTAPSTRPRPGSAG